MTPRLMELWDFYMRVYYNTLTLVEKNYIKVIATHLISSKKVKFEQCRCLKLHDAHTVA